MKEKMISEGISTDKASMIVNSIRSSIEKGPELERLFFEAVKNGMFGEDILEIMKTHEFDDYMNHVDGLIKLKSHEIYGFALDLTYTNGDNEEGIFKKISYTKNNIDDGHLYNIKYGPDGELKNIIRPLISIDKTYLKKLNNLEINNLEVSLYVYRQILLQLEYVGDYIQNKYVFPYEESDRESPKEYQNMSDAYEELQSEIRKLKNKKEEEIKKYFYDKSTEEGVRLSEGRRMDKREYDAKEKFEEIKNQQDLKMKVLDNALRRMF